MLHRSFKTASKLLLIASFLFLCGCENNFTGVLNPKGVVAFKERQLLFDCIALMLIVVIPVIIMSFAFAFRYRQSHPVKDYKPNWSHSVLLESIWWGVPCVIILILGILTWKMTHKLDPYRPIDGAGKPMKVQVVALPWKWLFIYPEQNIATVNTLVLPVNKQTEFFLTSDNVPMSAFFVPQIGSQIYTMAGMRTRLHLLPTSEGIYEGLNSQYNGDGFSEMHFKVKVVSQDEMKKWFAKAKRSSKSLSQATYRVVRQPTIADPAALYSGVAPGLFKQIIKSYHAPTHP